MPVSAPAYGAGRERGLLKRGTDGTSEDALLAVERSQRALPNAGDVDTEAKENILDETRHQVEQGSLANVRSRLSTTKSNTTFIVNTLTAESW